MKHLLNLLSALVLLSSAAPAADSPFNYDWSTNQPGVHIKFAWDPGSPFDRFGNPTIAADGTEMWGAFYAEGHERNVSWDDLLTGDETNRFRMVDVPGETTNCWASFPPGHYFLAVYAYCENPGYTNVWTNYNSSGEATITTNAHEGFRIRSERSNILELKIPAAVANLHLLSTETISGPATIEETVQVDLTGTDTKFFRMTLVATPPPPPLPPLP